MTALITARSICGLGARIIGVTTDLSAAPTRSRHWSELHLTSSAPEAYLRCLVQLGHRLNDPPSRSRPVLIVAQDPLVRLVADESQRLAELFEFVMPDRAAVDRLLDKTLFHEWAIQQGFPVPASTIVEDLRSLDEALDRCPYPLIVKPLVRTTAWDQRFSNLKFFSLSERGTPLPVKHELFAFSPRYVVQQWIPGGDDEVYFCLAYFDRSGQPRAWYTGRKLLQWPIQTGSTAVCVGTDAPDFERLTLDLLGRGGLKGLGSLEAKRNPLDGRFYITEPTVGRNDFQSYVATTGGVNLSRLAVLDALRLPLPAFEPGRRAAWFDELGALRAILRQRNMGVPLAMLRSSGGLTRLSSALWSWSDPAPALHRFVTEVSQTLSRLHRFSGARNREAPPRPAASAACNASVEVRAWSEREFLEGREQWSDLLSRADGDRLFLSWLWQSCWWRVFGPPHGLELRIYVAYRDAVPIGIAPMFLNVARQRGFNIRRLQSIGNIWRGPSTMRTEYLDMVLDREHATAAASALLQRLMADKDWDELVLMDLSRESAFYPLLAQGVKGARVRIPYTHSSYGIRTAQGLDAFRNALSESARRKLFGQRRRLEQLGAVRLRYFAAQEAAEFIAILNALHALRWGRPFFTGLMGEFHQQLLQGIATIGAARPSVLYVDDRAVSALYNLQVGSHEYNLQGGFDANFAPGLSLGKLHLGYGIEDAFRAGIQVIDLLVGGGKADDFKRQFAAPLASSCLLQVVRSRHLQLGYRVLDAARGGLGGQALLTVDPAAERP